VIEQMKILVVGGAGYVGGALTDLLSKANSLEFTVLDNLLYEDRFLKNVNFIYGDIRDTKRLNQIALDYDTVVWLAALVGDPLCALNKDLTIETNTNSLIRFAEDYKGKIVFMSTCSVYGAQDGLLTEESETNPLSLYAVTKLESEKRLLELKPDSLIFRLGTLFGMSDEFARLRADLVLNVLVMRAVFAGELTVFGGEQYRPLLHVKDVGRAILQGISSNASGIFNLHSENVTIIQLAQRIKQIDQNITIQVSTQTFQDARNYSVTSEKANKCFSFQTKFDVDYGINEVYKTLIEGRFPRILDETYSNVDKMRSKFIPISNSLVKEYYKGFLS
jgi:nucleoside-diphosphate-sugar epimerase